MAVLSRTAISRYVSHAAERDGAGRLLWPRDCVEVHLEASGQRIAIVGSHLSSRLSDDGTRRAAQASRMRAIADAIAAGDAAALVVAGGDLNDPPSAPAIAPLTDDGAYVNPLPPSTTTWSSGSGRSGSTRCSSREASRARSCALPWSKGPTWRARPTTSPWCWMCGCDEVHRPRRAPSTASSRAQTGCGREVATVRAARALARGGVQAASCVTTAVTSM